jgi:predicted transcriptional regulator
LPRSPRERLSPPHSPKTERTNVNWKPTDTEALVYELIKSGVDSNSDIAQELDITPGMVSRYAKKLINDNFIKKEGQRYVLSYDQHH